MCPLPDQLPIICNPDEFSFSGSLICTSCPKGFSCSSSDDDPVSCRTGEYSNMTHCVSCLAGFYCPDPSLPPFPCPSGLYASAHGLTSCQVCPVGHHCVDPAQSPVPCSSGTFSLSGSSLCLVSSLLQIIFALIIRSCFLTCSLALKAPSVKLVKEGVLNVLLVTAATMAPLATYQFLVSLGSTVLEDKPSAYLARKVLSVFTYMQMSLRVH